MTAERPRSSTATAAYDRDRQYRDGTLILDTTFRTDSGTVVLTDALTFGEGVGGHELGRRSEWLLVRRAVVTDGVVELRVEIVPRPEYGRIQPIVGPDARRFRTRGGASALVVSCSAPLELKDSSASAVVELGVGQSVELAVAHADPWADPPAMPTADEITVCLDETAEAWRT